MLVHEGLADGWDVFNTPGRTTRVLLIFIFTVLCLGYSQEFFWNNEGCEYLRADILFDHFFFFILSCTSLRRRLSSIRVLYEPCTTSVSFTPAFYAHSMHAPRFRLGWCSVPRRIREPLNIATHLSHDVQSKATKRYAEYTDCTVKNEVSSFQKYMMPIDLKMMQGLNIRHWICHCVIQSKAG